MRIAVLSDIHGNKTALKACLAHAEEQGAERYVFLGDYVGEMPWPECVMDCLYLLSKRYPCTFVRGNKEDYWLNADPAWQAGDSTTGMLWYNMQHLRQKDLAFFDGLPYAATLRLPDFPPVTLCHGTPENVTKRMRPNDAATEALMARDPNDLILCGHFHEQAVIRYNNKLALNPGAVGVPLGSEGKTQYMLLIGAADGWTYRMIALEYDVAGVLAELKAAGLYETAPAWSRVTAYVLRHGTFSHAAVLRRAMEICQSKNGVCVWPRIPEDCWQEAMDEMLV